MPGDIQMQSCGQRMMKMISEILTSNSMMLICGAYRLPALKRIPRQGLCYIIYMSFGLPDSIPPTMFSLSVLTWESVGGVVCMIVRCSLAIRGTGRGRLTNDKADRKTMDADRLKQIPERSYNVRIMFPDRLEEWMKAEKMQSKY